MMQFPYDSRGRKAEPYGTEPNPAIRDIKRRAQELKCPDVSQSQALERLAKEQGFRTYAAFLAHHKGTA